MLFGSGYLANTGVIAALAHDGIVASDERNHASIIDGCRLARAQTRVYPHGEIPRGADVIVTDAVFCMDGDVAPLEALVETGARVIVDEAHATGVIGPTGRGLVAELGLEVDVVIGTLGKALGSYGAFACCSARDRRRARQPGAHADLLHRAAAAEHRRRAQGAGADGPRPRRPAARERARAARGAGRRVSDMPIVPLIVGAPEDATARERGGAATRRVRPGDPPPDRPGGHLAAAPGRHRRARSGRSPPRR